MSNDKPKMLSMLERYVPALNALDRPNEISHPMLPNGGIVLAPGEVYRIPAQVWSTKFRQFGLQRATPDEEAAWQARGQTGARVEVPTELEDTRLDRLRETAGELGIVVKGNKAQVVLTVRAALLAKTVCDHAAKVIETIAQGAYEFERAERIKDGEDVPSWSDASDETKAGTIARTLEVGDDDNAFHNARRLLEQAAEGKSR